MDQLNAREQQEFQQLVEKKQMKDFMRVSAGGLYRRLRDLR
jgi:import inner membrane translocase subunit TIM9